MIFKWKKGKNCIIKEIVFQKNINIFYVILCGDQVGSYDT